MNFQYKKGPIKITEVLGNRDIRALGDKRSDVIQTMELLLSAPERLIKKVAPYSFEINIPNYILDLKQDEDEIFNRIHKSTRADIRKAIKREHFNYIEVEKPTDEQIEEFSRFYNEFAKEKEIALCNVMKLNSIKERNCLILTYITDEHERRLCGSMLLLDRVNSQLYGIYGVTNRHMQTNQSERNTISRANKLLQWKEIQLGKKKELDWYNFGGEVDKKSQGVNDFKKRFGTINAYDKRIYVSNSHLGRVATFFLYEKWKKNLRSNQLKEELYDPKSVVD